MHIGSHFPNPRIRSSYGFYHDDWDLEESDGTAQSARRGPDLEVPATIEVTVIRAKDLLPADVTGTSDPFVTVRALPRPPRPSS